MKQLTIKSPSFIYLEKSFKEWLDVLGYAPSTVYQLPHYARELFYYLESQGHTQINQLTIPLIKQYHEQLKERTNQKRGGALSNNALNKHIQAYYKLLEYLRKVGKLTLPDLNLDREEADSKGIEVLTIEEIKELYKVAEQLPELTAKSNSSIEKWEAIAARDKAMLAIFYGCGLRRNEGYHLDLSDINWDRSTLHVRKGKNYKERIVPFNKTNQKRLELYVFDYRPYFQNKRKENALFLSIKGNRMEGQSLGIRLKLLQQKTDDITLQQKEITLHTLRHSIATHLLSAGMQLEKISRFLGHSSLESTQIYTHLIQQTDGNI